MSSQIRLKESIAGSGQPRLDDYLEAVNDFMGIAGDDWNNKGLGGRFDADVPFNGNLVNVAGGNLASILQAIDNMSVSGADTSITGGTLPNASGARVVPMSGYDLTFSNTASFTVAATRVNLQAPFASVDNTNAALSGVMRFIEATNNGVGYVDIAAPLDLTSGSYKLLLPDAPGTAGQAVKVASVNGSDVTLEFGDASGVDSNFATQGLTRTAGAGDLTHQFNNNKVTLASSAGFKFDANLELGSGFSATFIDDTTGTLAFQPPSAYSENQTYTLPEAYPTVNNQALIATTGGVMDWRSFVQPTLTITASTNGGVYAGGLGDLSLNRQIQLDLDNLAINTTIADADKLIFEDDSASGSGNVRAITFSNLRDALNILAEGKYRGGVTLGAAPNLPDQNDGTHRIGEALEVGDSWKIVADGTLDDGVGGTKSVNAGDLLLLESATPTTVNDYSVIRGATAVNDTNMVHQDLPRTRCSVFA